MCIKRGPLSIVTVSFPDKRQMVKVASEPGDRMR